MSDRRQRSALEQDYLDTGIGERIERLLKPSLEQF